MTTEIVYFIKDGEAIKRLTEKPKTEHLEKTLLVADEGKTLENGTRQLKRVVCNADEVINWQEVELPTPPENDEEEATIDDYIEALQELGVEI